MRKSLLFMFLAGAILLGAIPMAAQTGAERPGSQPVVMEYYYRVKWGHQDEFLALFKKNHLPLLQHLLKNGDILEIKMERPGEHAVEESRWDFRVTLTFRDAATAFDDSGDEALLKKLFPDQERFKREEQQRFQLLLAHWDVRVVPVKTN